MQELAYNDPSPGGSRPLQAAHRTRMLVKTGLVVLVIGAFLALIPACSSTTANRDPLGERFPSVRGESLDGEEFVLPKDLGGQPAVLLLGYVQKAQFDVDRWLLGLLQAEVPARVLELPTIKGMIPGMFSGKIDSGMRSGIPSEDWGVVVTVYGDDASRLVDFTGNEGPRNTRVLLLDGEGRVRWSHDRGYSAGKLLELDAAVREILAAR